MHVHYKLVLHSKILLYLRMVHGIYAYSRMQPIHSDEGAGLPLNEVLRWRSCLLGVITQWPSQFSGTAIAFKIVFFSTLKILPEYWCIMTILTKSYSNVGLHRTNNTRNSRHMISRNRTVHSTDNNITFVWNGGFSHVENASLKSLESLPHAL